MKKWMAAIFAVCFFICVAETSAHPPWALAVDERHRVYLSDLETIWRIEADGAVSIFRRGVAGRHTHDFRLDADGNLLGEDLQYEPATEKFIVSLWKMTPNGDFSYALAPTDAPPQGVSVWKNKDGAAYYFGRPNDQPNEPFLLKRAANGAVSVLFGNRDKALRERQTILYSLAGMTFAPDGKTLFVSDRERVWRVGADDKVELLFDGKKDRSQFGGLTVDGKNNVFAADSVHRRILKIAPDGKAKIFASTENDWTPNGVYFRGEYLYVSDYKNQPPGAPPVFRVRKIDADGKVSNVATISQNQSADFGGSNQNSALAVQSKQANAPAIHFARQSVWRLPPV